MNSRKHPANTGPRPGPKQAWRVLFVLALAAVMAIGQYSPAMSGSNAEIWVEICGDDGTYLALLDIENQENPRECSHCSACVVGAGFATPQIPPVGAALGLSSFIAVPRLAAADVLPAGLVPYLPPSRGPPTTSFSFSMTPNTSLPFKERTGVILPATWSFPWV